MERPRNGLGSEGTFEGSRKQAHEWETLRLSLQPSSVTWGLRRYLLSEGSAGTELGSWAEKELIVSTSQRKGLSRGHQGRDSTM